MNHPAPVAELAGSAGAGVKLMEDSMKYIDKLSNIEAIIVLLEILEIKTENKIIVELQEEVTDQLKKIIKNINNPDYMIEILLEVRKNARN